MKRFITIFLLGTMLLSMISCEAIPTPSIEDFSTPSGAETETHSKSPVPGTTGEYDDPTGKGDGNPQHPEPEIPILTPVGIGLQPEKYLDLPPATEYHLNGFYHAILKNVIHLNTLPGRQDQYTQFAVLDPDKNLDSLGSALLLRSAESILMIHYEYEMGYHMKYLPNAESYQFNTNGTYTWNRITDEGFEYGLSTICLTRWEADLSHTIYRVVNKGIGDVTYYIQTKRGDEQQVEQEEFLTFLKQLDDSPAAEFHNLNTETIQAVLPCDAPVSLPKADFESYESIALLCRALSCVCVTRKYPSAPVEQLDVLFDIPDEHAYEYFRRLSSMIDISYPFSASSIGPRGVIGYSLKDLNGDGEYEMILMMDNCWGLGLSETDYMIIAVFSMYQGEIVYLGQDWNPACWIDENGLIYSYIFSHFTDPDHTYIYKLSSDASHLETVEHYWKKQNPDQSTAFYRAVGENEAKITEEEYTALCNLYAIPPAFLGDHRFYRQYYMEYALTIKFHCVFEDSSEYENGK